MRQSFKKLFMAFLLFLPVYSQEWYAFSGNGTSAVLPYSCLSFPEIGNVSGRILEVKSSEIIYCNTSQDFTPPLEQVNCSSIEPFNVSDVRYFCGADGILFYSNNTPKDRYNFFLYRKNLTPPFVVIIKGSGGCETGEERGDGKYNRLPGFFIRAKGILIGIEDIQNYTGLNRQFCQGLKCTFLERSWGECGRNYVYIAGIYTRKILFLRGLETVAEVYLDRPLNSSVDMGFFMRECGWENSSYKIGGIRIIENATLSKIEKILGQKETVGEGITILSLPRGFFAVPDDPEKCNFTLIATSERNIQLINATESCNLTIFRTVTDVLPGYYSKKIWSFFDKFLNATEIYTQFDTTKNCSVDVGNDRLELGYFGWVNELCIYSRENYTQKGLFVFFGKNKGYSREYELKFHFLIPDNLQRWLRFGIRSYLADIIPFVSDHGYVEANGSYGTNANYSGFILGALALNISRAVGYVNGIEVVERVLRGGEAPEKARIGFSVYRQNSTLYWLGWLRSAKMMAVNPEIPEKIGYYANITQPTFLNTTWEVRCKNCTLIYSPDSPGYLLLPEGLITEIYVYPKKMGPVMVMPGRILLQNVSSWINKAKILIDADSNITVISEGTYLEAIFFQNRTVVLRQVNETGTYTCIYGTVYPYVHRISVGINSSEVYITKENGERFCNNLTGRILGEGKEIEVIIEFGRASFPEIRELNFTGPILRPKYYTGCYYGISGIPISFRLKNETLQVYCKDLEGHIEEITENAAERYRELLKEPPYLEFFVNNCTITTISYINSSFDIYCRKGVEIAKMGYCNSTGSCILEREEGKDVAIESMPVKKAKIFLSENSTRPVVCVTGNRPLIVFGKINFAGNECFRPGINKRVYFQPHVGSIKLELPENYEILTDTGNLENVSWINITLRKREETEEGGSKGFHGTWIPRSPPVTQNTTEVNSTVAASPIKLRENKTDKTEKINDTGITLEINVIEDSSENSTELNGTKSGPTVQKLGLGVLGILMAFGIGGVLFIKVWEEKYRGR